MSDAVSPPPVPTADSDAAPAPVIAAVPNTPFERDGKLFMMANPMPETSVPIPEEPLEFEIKPDDVPFNLEPLHIGPTIIYKNARDPTFYHRQPSDPVLTVWCISKSDGVVGYVKRRLHEAFYARNIAFHVKATHKFELFATKDGLDTVYYDGKPIELPDAIIVRVGATVDYFGLAVIRQLEKNDVLVLNPAKSIEISRDKLFTMQHLAGGGIPIPKSLLVRFPLDLDLVDREFTYPIIIKKASGSQGKGIVKIESREQFEDLVDLVDTADPLLVQEFLSASSGRDLRVYVVGGRVVAAMMRTASKGFKANVHQGGSVKSVALTGPIEWLSLDVVAKIGLDIAGVDLLIDNTTYKVCEVNSSPGFEGLERATGVNIANLHVEYIRVRMGVYKLRRGKRDLGPSVPVSSEHRREPTSTGAGAGAGAGAH